MKCEICGGSGTMLDGIEDNGDPCPDCHGTGTKPEPEQVLWCEGCQHFVGYEGQDSKECIKGFIPVDCNSFMPWESNRQDEIFKAEIEEKDKIINELDKLHLEQKKEIEALKAEIESMRCCGNCGQAELPKEEKTCNSCKRGVEWSDVDNWTRKTKNT